MRPRKTFQMFGNKSPIVGLTLNKASRSIKIPIKIKPYSVELKSNNPEINTDNLAPYTEDISKDSNILIVMDELIAYHNLPNQLLDKLPGYKAFKNIGIEFTNIHNNRQMCSPSRASFQTSTINTGVQSNIDQPFQNFFVPHLSYDSLTIPKSLKAFNSDIITAYYGKEHLQCESDTVNNITPAFHTNTSNLYKCYGFDISSKHGDIFYNDGHGFIQDNLIFNNILNNTTNNCDYIAIDPLTNEKVGYIGVIPFLKSRSEDKKQFHLQYHITNPHDTQQFWQNFSMLPTNEQSQFFASFLKEQTTDIGIKNPYYYNEFFPNAYIENENLTTNFFEDNFDDYCKKLDLLPFKESYVNDYVTSSKTNPINDYYKCFYNQLGLTFSIANDSSDVKSWKNLLNNYYGLVIEADKYLFKIYNFLKNNNMLERVSVVITSDHGDTMSAHGLKQKATPFKENINVPLIVYSSKISKAYSGKKCDVLGSLLDLAPTINVLLGINDINSQFLGKSLVLNNNNILTPRTTNLPVMNIYNDFMTSTSYFLKSTSTTFYDYKFCFNMIIDYDDDGTLYKYGRFFSINELFSYNFTHNNSIPKLTPSIFNDPKFVIDSQYINPEITTSILNEIYNPLKEKFPDGFNYTEGFDFIKNTYKNSDLPNYDSLELMVYFNVINNYLKYYINYQFILPYVYDDYELLSITNPEIFCYNIKNDYNEITNLYYQNNDFQYNPLFERLNKKLNNLIIEQCMTINDRFTFIIPSIIYELIILHSYKFGIDYENYTKEQKNFAVTSFYNNNQDSKFSFINSVQSLTKYI